MIEDFYLNAFIIDSYNYTIEAGPLFIKTLEELKFSFERFERGHYVLIRSVPSQ